MEDPELLKRELSVQIGAGSPFIVQVFDAFVEGFDMFVVMEQAKWGSLAAYRDGEGSGRLMECEVAGMVAQIAKGLEFLHSRQFVHRDLKEDNCLVCYQGFESAFPKFAGSTLGDDITVLCATIKIADFGLARESVVAGATGAIGTSGYIAPELRSGGGVTCAADLFSLGSICYNLLCLEDSGSRTFEAVDSYDLEKLSKSRSPDAVGLLRRLLAEDPLSRIQAWQVTSHDFFGKPGGNPLLLDDEEELRDKIEAPEFLRCDLEEAYKKDAWEALKPYARNLQFAVTKASLQATGERLSGGVAVAAYIEGPPHNL